MLCRFSRIVQLIFHLITVIFLRRLNNYYTNTMNILTIALVVTFIGALAVLIDKLYQLKQKKSNFSGYLFPMIAFGVTGFGAVVAFSSGKQSAISSAENKRKYDSIAILNTIQYQNIMDHLMVGGQKPQIYFYGANELGQYYKMFFRINNLNNYPLNDVVVTILDKYSNMKEVISNVKGTTYYPFDTTDLNINKIIRIGTMPPNLTGEPFYEGRVPISFSKFDYRINVKWAQGYYDWVIECGGDAKREFAQPVKAELYVRGKKTDPIEYFSAKK